MILIPYSPQPSYSTSSAIAANRTATGGPFSLRRPRGVVCGHHSHPKIAGCHGLAVSHPRFGPLATYKVASGPLLVLGVARGHPLAKGSLPLSPCGQRWPASHPMAKGWLSGHPQNVLGWSASHPPATFGVAARSLPLSLRGRRATPRPRGGSSATLKMFWVGQRVILGGCESFSIFF